MKHFYLFILLIVHYQINAQFCTSDHRFTEVDYFSSAQIDSVTNLTYASFSDSQGNQQDLLIDFYFPNSIEDSLQKRPFILLIHGGGFAIGNKMLMRDKCFEFARKGFVAATMNYRLGNFQAGDVRYRAQQDAHSAMRFVVDQAEAWRIDTTWLFIGGRSSGSMAALGLAYLDQKDWNTIDSSSVSDLGPLDAFGNNLNPEFSIKGVFNNWGNVDSTGVSASDNIPMIAFHGENDPIINIDTSQLGWGSRALHNFFFEQGICSDLTIDPTGGHGVYDNPEGAKFRVRKASCFFKSIFCDNCVSISTTDSIAAQCSITTSIDNPINERSITVYPNPFGSTLHMEGLKGEEKIILYNAMGQIVAQWNSEQNLDLEELPSGLYLLEIKAEGLRQIEKLYKR